MLLRSRSIPLVSHHTKVSWRLSNACRLMWSLRTPTARGENCSEEEALFVFESEEARRTLCRFHRLLLKAPELKAMSVDCRFDRIAGEIVRGSGLGRMAPICRQGLN